MNFEKWDALHTVIHFGKYKGETVESILELDPGYLQWLLDINVQNSLRDSLEYLRKEINIEVEKEREDLYDMYAGYPDPMWD